MATKEWVSVHRKHHARSDSAEDPHSPQTHGIRKVLLPAIRFEPAKTRCDMEGRSGIAAVQAFSRQLRCYA